MDHVRLEDLLNRHVDGDLTGEDRREFERMLLDSPDARGVFWRFARLNSLIRDNFQSQTGWCVAVGLPHQLKSRAPNPESPVFPFPSLSPLPSFLPPDFVGSWTFACMVSTVLMCVMLLVLWAIEITPHQHIAEVPSQSAPSYVRPEMVFVGRITGMVDVKWSDDPRYMPPPDFAHVPLDRKYILSSGLLEITYDSGAKVILEGPCTYEVESTASGYLLLGKLTARVGVGDGGRGTGKSGINQKSEIRNQKSPSSFILHPSSLFSVRTPTAIVTDLGTEFGVEVDKSGVTQSHVFRGKVEMRLSGGLPSTTGRGAGGEGHAIRLGVGESARVGPDQDQVIRIIRSGATSGLPSSSGLPSKPEAFVRQMPKWVRIELFNTGVGLKEGDEDPHWQLVARSDDPDFQPRPAVVSAAHVNWQSNYAARSQWISTATGPPDVPNVAYTFRTTFELADALLETAVLRGRFLVDNHVQAIRLNGKEVPASEHRYDQLSWFNEISEFSASKGFVEGANTLEIDVLNGRPSEAGDSGPMGLRVELGGYVFSREKGG